MLQRGTPAYLELVVKGVSTPMCLVISQGRPHPVHRVHRGERSPWGRIETVARQPSVRG